MYDICFDLEWTIIMHLYRNRAGGKNKSSMHLNSEWRTLFPVVYFHASQVGYTPVVNISNVLNMRKFEKLINIVGLAFRKLMGSSSFCK
jgi:hypothetical protein